MITMPMPALKPVSTGAEMNDARKPRRSTDAATRNAPTISDSVAVDGQQPRRVRVRRDERQLAGDENRNRRRRRHAERTRGAEQRIDDERDEAGVEPGLDRQARDRGVGQRFGDDDRGGRQAGDDVEARGDLADGLGHRASLSANVASAAARDALRARHDTGVEHAAARSLNRRAGLTSNTGREISDGPPPSSLDRCDVLPVPQGTGRAGGAAQGSGQGP